jgi:hypothetical protein
MPQFRITRFTIFAALVIAVAALVSSTGVFANDSIARFGAGGIELVKNEQIRMLEETLEISVKEVGVRYRFLNESDRNIHTTVAFPFPNYHPLDLIEVPGGDGAKTVKETLKALVNGKPVATKLVRKAVLGTRDITHQLRKLGLSDKEIFFVVTVDDAPALAEKVAKFRDKFGEWWQIDETAFWEMTFPAGKETVVEHKYVPAVGRFYDGGKIPRDLGEDSADEVCLDQSTRRAIERQIKAFAGKGTETVTVSVRDVEYILGTARNWKGPIGEFTLRVKKEQPDEFVSLCFPGKPKKVSPTVYEFHEKDFVPPDKLVVYFYSAGQEVSQ